ncbi:MAG: right-handed parallel beta-helix repeat-containing protein [Deltaproteobacteria bacterium]|nr:right-handed parallel beta-helix repeat-containing protein [Deltaproteobacteria bacterium]
MSLTSSPGRSTVLLLAFGLVLLGCPPDDVPEQPPDAQAPLEGPPDAAAPPSCPAGERATGDDGNPCAPVFPADCPAGTQPRLGAADCVPVGWLDCPAGFQKDPSGWGCQEIVPASACTDYLRDGLGSTECQPIGDCDAPFPPSEAEYFVDESFTNPVAPNFSNITDALAAAPGGATIAIEAGTYLESLLITKPVTLVGRCAARFTLLSVSGPRPGIEVRKVHAEARGFAIVNQLFGLGVHQGGSLRALECLIAQSQDIAVYVSGAGASVTLERCVVRDTQMDAQDAYGIGVYVVNGASATLQDTAVTGNRSFGLVVGDPDQTQDSASVTMRRSIIRDTRPSPAMGYGQGMHLEGPATITVEESVVRDNQDGIAVKNPATTLTLAHSVVRGSRPNAEGLFGYGITLANGAEATLTSCAIVGNTTAGVLANGLDYESKPKGTIRSTVIRNTMHSPSAPYGYGAAAQAGGRLEIWDSALVGNTNGGVVANLPGSSLVLTRTTVRDTQANQGGGFGLGASIQKGCRLEASASSFMGNREASVLANGEGARLDLRDTLVSGTLPQLSGPPFGLGLIVKNGAFMNLQDSLVEKSTAIGIAVANASARLDHVYVSDNPVGLHIQEGVTLENIASVPEEVPAQRCVVSTSSRFVHNEVTLSSEYLPLPESPDW